MRDIIGELVVEHKKLDWQIKKLELLSPSKEMEIKKLKKEKLQLKDKIEALRIT